MPALGAGLLHRERARVRGFFGLDLPRRNIDLCFDLATLPTQRQKTPSDCRQTACALAGQPKNPAGIPRARPSHDTRSQSPPHARKTPHRAHRCARPSALSRDRSRRPRDRQARRGHSRAGWAPAHARAIRELHHCTDRVLSDLVRGGLHARALLVRTGQTAGLSVPAASWNWSSSIIVSSACATCRCRRRLRASPIPCLPRCTHANRSISRSTRCRSALIHRHTRHGISSSALCIAADLSHPGLLGLARAGTVLHRRLL
jgi:hypothetical protein